MADMGNTKVDRRILLPGVSLGYLKEADAFEFFKEEHKSRNSLHNLIFKLKFDIEKGRPDYHGRNTHHNNLKVCFDLPKLMEQDSDYDD